MVNNGCFFPSAFRTLDLKNRKQVFQIQSLTVNLHLDHFKVQLHNVKKNSF